MGRPIVTYKARHQRCALPKFWRRSSHFSAGDTAKVAVACDDGSLRLFQIDEAESGLQYSGSMPRLEVELLISLSPP